MIADRPQARLLLDDESSLALRAASKDFLAADRQIAAINRQQRAKTAARATAARAAADYRTLGVEADTARAWAVSMHEAYDGRRDLLAAYARRAYQTGRPFDDADIASLVEVAGRLGDSATRAELRLAAVLMSQEQARKDFDQATARYQQASRALATMKTRLAALAERRSAALDRVRAARSGDLALHQARLAESGALGAQIRAASARLRATGRAVDGTGVFVRPGSGMVTSGFGMRRHPILHYTKLHTGTDFSQGDGTAYAANTGRVLFTLVSEAYGNMTVIDHGTVRGRHIATLYAHQARVLVRDGQRVHRGQPIGVIGSTGYSTGPHLHFEVRQDGAPMEPLLWLR